MKTIYLKAATKAALIAAIQKVIPEYDGEVEFGNGEIFGHYIGDLGINFEHANLLVPDNFDSSIFEFDGFVPHNPKHQFA